MMTDSSYWPSQREAVYASAQALAERSGEDGVNLAGWLAREAI
jgi:hypothetical protein